MRRRTFTGISRDIALVRRALARHFARTPRDPARPPSRRERKTQPPQALKAHA